MRRCWRHSSSGPSGGWINEAANIIKHLLHGRHYTSRLQVHCSLHLISKLHLKCQLQKEETGFPLIMGREQGRQLDHRSKWVERDFLLIHQISTGYLLCDTLLRASDTLPNGNLIATLECSVMILILEMGKWKLFNFCQIISTYRPLPINPGSKAEWVWTQFLHL